MLKYITKRLLMLIPVLIGVSIITFSLIHLIPGDPARSMLGEKATEEQLSALRQELGLNDPYIVQYGRFLGDILQGDLGQSIQSKESIGYELLHKLPATVELTLFAMLLAVSIGILAGVIAAVKQYSWFDNISMTGALFGVSLPIFWLGLMMIWFFSVKLNILPPSGRLTPGIEMNTITNFYLLDSLLTGNFRAFKDAFLHLLMPGIALGTIPMAIIARMTRSSMLEVMKQDYIRTADAKGLKTRLIIFHHALKNAFLPVLTVIGLQFGLLLGGAVLTETIFSWPGIGRYVYLAVLGRDYPVVQSTILIVATIFVLVNLLTDLLYKYFDPRIRYE
ncbi:dipeptide transport system permease protein DppB [Oceanobacillus picturae]|jgi:peptide/nickel transport system permease protein|uniref:Dipeptide transport system permease protein DppB n=2 Tax=Oceanobacillus TaxID=182709 RepID=A0A0U9H703_9BACI|nr:MULTISPECIES: ABC transporter permease [Oceanobacillus]AVQ99828.1 peptide ABC transporter permease [Oceanobacillus iheyensis]MCG3420529.1 ABC transporter permease [Oceanobacillus jordanicus]GAQ18501.1 dipeptide transport system permease protein DppB [Oceanobacillus picturae]